VPAPATAVLLPPLPVPADPFPQPATITAIMARAASGHSVLLMVFLPAYGDLL
jgi:hypothetical protein